MWIIPPETTNPEDDHVPPANDPPLFEYLIQEEGIPMANPVTRIPSVSQPLPRHLKDDQVTRLLAMITT